MSRIATPIFLSHEESAILNRWLRSGKAEQRLVLRGSIILMAAQGVLTKEIAAKLGVRPSTVSRWRKRFALEGIGGLQDAPRTGKPKIYGADVEERILRKMKEAPPPGQESWTGHEIALALGDVSEYQVWRVLRRRDVKLSRQRNWRILTDQQFIEKTADIIGMFLSPPENVIVIGVGEKGRSKPKIHGDLKAPDRSFAMQYTLGENMKPVSSLYETLAIAKIQALAGRSGGGRRRRFLDFMDGIIHENPVGRIHVVLNSYRTHKPGRDRWLGQHKKVRFHYMSSYEIWLAQIEIWFSIFMQGAVKGEEFHSEKQLCRAIAEFNAAYSKNSSAFEWKKLNG